MSYEPGNRLSQMLAVGLLAGVVYAVVQAGSWIWSHWYCLLFSF